MRANAQKKRSMARGWTHGGPPLLGHLGWGLFGTLTLYENIIRILGGMARGKCRVEKWRGGLGGPIRPALSCARASRALPCSVSTSRSSKRTCSFPASGSRRLLPPLTAPIPSGWNVLACRAGVTPAETQRLFRAHGNLFSALGAHFAIGRTFYWVTGWLNRS